MAQLTITVPDVTTPRIKAAAVARGFDADGDGEADAADMRAFVVSLVRREVARIEGQRAGEAEAARAAADFGG